MGKIKAMVKILCLIVLAVNYSPIQAGNSVQHTRYRKGNVSHSNSTDIRVFEEPKVIAKDSTQGHEVLHSNNSSIKDLSLPNNIIPSTQKERNEIVYSSIPAKGKNLKSKLSDPGKGPKRDAKVEGFALSGMILGLLGILIICIMVYQATNFQSGFIPFFILLPILALLALIFSQVGLTRILNNREKYKGLGFAIAAMLLGILVALGTIGAFMTL
jgi:hypothetical protein